MDPRLQRESDRRLANLHRAIGLEVQRLRHDSGLSLRALADPVGIHHSHLHRLERGEASPSLEVLQRIATGLGADLSVRIYPNAGPRIHDRIQAPMIQALVASLRRGLECHPEVPIREPVRGYIDLVIVDPIAPRLLAVEAQSELRRLESQIRRHRDVADGLARTELARFAGGDPAASPVVDRVLLLRSTQAMREIARTFEAVLRAAYPARTADLVAALTSPAPWPGSGIAWVLVDGARTHLLDGPPRGVTLGRR
jgi:transcriptional regulator with XRE-family HTH domain